MIFNFLSPPKVGGEYRGGFFFLAYFIHEIEHVAIDFARAGMGCHTERSEVSIFVCR